MWSKIATGEKDFAFCGMTPISDANVKFTDPYMMQNVVWLIPVSILTSPWSSIFRPLHKHVWYLVITTLIICLILIRLSRRRIPCLIAFGLFIGAPIAKMPEGFFVKTQIMILILYGYLIAQCYVASLASDLNNPMVSEIDTMKELVDSRMRIGGLLNNRLMFESDTRYENIFNKYEVFEEDEYYEMRRGFEDGVQGAPVVALVAQVLEGLMTSPRYHVMKERIARYPTVAAMSTKSAFYLDTKIGIEMMIEGGLIDVWWQRETAKLNKRYLKFYDPSSSTEPSILTLEEVIGVFFVLIAGLSLSALVFVCEVYLQNTPKRKVPDGKSLIREKREKLQPDPDPVKRNDLRF